MARFKIGGTTVEAPDVDTVEMHIHVHAAEEPNIDQESSEDSSGKPWRKHLRQLDSGTDLRHEFQRGPHAGEVAEAHVNSVGDVVYDGNDGCSPSRAVKLANRDIKNKDYGDNGWEFWEFYDEDNDEWALLDTLRN